MRQQSVFQDLVINGELVPQSVVAAEAQNHQAPPGRLAAAWRQAARAIAIRTLLLQVARRDGLTPAPEEVGPGRFETEEEALIRAVLDRAVAVGPPPAETVEAEWRRDPARFRSPPLWEVSHILCTCDPRNEAARERALLRAQAITAEALKRPEQFAALAQRESDCDSKNNGGALGQLGPGDSVPEFEAAVRQLEDGAITAEPVLSRYGYHVIRLDALAPGRELPYQAVRDKLAEAMEKAAWTRAAQQFVEALVAAADIKGIAMDVATGLADAPEAGGQEMSARAAGAREEKVAQAILAQQSAGQQQAANSGGGCGSGGCGCH